MKIYHFYIIFQFISIFLYINFQVRIILTYIFMCVLLTKIFEFDLLSFVLGSNSLIDCILQVLILGIVIQYLRLDNHVFDNLIIWFFKLLELVNENVIFNWRLNNLIIIFLFLFQIYWYLVEHIHIYLTSRVKVKWWFQDTVCVGFICF